MMGGLARVWAIAGMTLVEARRRKVFTILLLFSVALMSSILFFPAVEVEGRLRLIEVWALRSSALFTAIVGLFLAGFSLPQDFETKRIYLIVTKPVSKPMVFLGRYLGFALLLTVFVFAMGGLTSIFLRTVKVFSSDRFPALVAYPRVRATEFLMPPGAELKDQAAAAAVGFGADRYLTWTWEGLRRDSFDDRAKMQLRLIFGAENDPFRASGTVDVRVLNAAGGKYSTQLTMNTNEEVSFEFPADLIRPDGPMRVEVRVVDADGIVASSPDWMLLYEKSMLFEFAFGRGLILILLQSLVVLSITLMSSTFLSAPLSILLGILLYLVGSIHGYVREGSREIDRSLAEIRQSKERVPSPEGLPPGLLKFSTETSKAVLAAVPDFAHFDFSVWLLKDHAVSWREIGSAGNRALPPIAVLVSLGLLIMAFKDFDR